MIKRRFGFTLIELLVVIAIIAILASIIVLSYANAQTKARDNKRRADVQAIASAFQIHYQDTKQWYIPGTGYAGNGYGWFNRENGVYTKSIAHGLEEGQYLTSEPKDPLMKDGSDESHQYMVWLCSGSGLTVYAKMEIPVQSEIDEAKKGCNAIGSNGAVDYYKMTFGVTLK